MKLLIPIIGILLALAWTALVLYVAIHFITKYW